MIPNAASGSFLIEAGWSISVSYYDTTFKPREDIYIIYHIGTLQEMRSDRCIPELDPLPWVCW